MVQHFDKHTRVRLNDEILKEAKVMMGAWPGRWESLSHYIRSAVMHFNHEKDHELRKEGRFR